MNIIVEREAVLKSPIAPKNIKDYIFYARLNSYDKKFISPTNTAINLLSLKEPLVGHQLVLTGSPEKPRVDFNAQDSDKNSWRILVSSADLANLLRISQESLILGIKTAQITNEVLESYVVLDQNVMLAERLPKPKELAKACTQDKRKSEIVTLNPQFQRPLLNKSGNRRQLLEPWQQQILCDFKYDTGEQELNRPKDFCLKAKRSAEEYRILKKNESRFWAKPRKSNTQDKIDEAFRNYLIKTPHFKYLDNNHDLWPHTISYMDTKDMSKRAVAAKIFFKAEFNPYDSLPKGNYAEFALPTFANARFAESDFYPMPIQGWKIHVSATPKSAKAIAALVIRSIDKDIKLAGENFKRTRFKIIWDIPLMRTLYYITGNLAGDGRETQVGKFITIYPANQEHAVAIVNTLNNIFMGAIEGGLLNESDFVASTGDAKVGESGAIYVRYGNFTNSQEIVKVIPYKTNQFLFNNDEYQSCEAVLDKRNIPWPDFMNTNNPKWAKAPNPFADLKLSYKAKFSTKEITWESRPDTW